MIPGTHNTAFKKIYDSTHSRVYHFVLKLCWNKTDLTDDIVQDCYLKFWNTIDVPDESVNYLPLLYTIAKNLLINMHRKMIATRRKEMEWLHSQEQETSDTIDMYMRHKATNEKMENMLSQMPERRRKIYLLCKEEGLSHKEIAAMLNISRDTVEQQINLSMKHLRKEYSKNIIPAIAISALFHLLENMK